MKLSEALAHAKAEMEAAEDAEALHETLGYLVDAVEEHLEAERKSAETLLCLADLQRHGGE